MTVIVHWVILTIDFKGLAWIDVLLIGLLFFVLNSNQGLRSFATQNGSLGVFFFNDLKSNVIEDS